ncbi:retrovirus-related Pol polyprotein from transposon 297 [Trichonephila clavipes]|nr:retrovirus-related Pol polyprotein from transposon 297 [Trichonephila clavipes]
MSPVELPYVLILLNEILRKALWDTDAEKSFISEDIYRKYFFYKQRICETLDVSRADRFRIPMCILGDDFISGSKIILDFDRKALAIPDSQIEKVVTMIEEGNVEIDLTKIGLEESQKKELQDLFNSFKGLFSDKLGLTHVLYHEIETGDKPLVVSRPYLNDRVKKSNLDYHVEKMLKEGIIPIKSPYASPVVLSRKNNRLPPDNPEAYRFAMDYRKLNAITKYPRYPLPLINDLITNTPHTTIMSSLYLRSGYFQLVVNPSDIGLIISKDGIPTDETKVLAIVQMNLPKNSKEVSKFLEMSQWCSKFIKNYTDLCEPFYNLKKKFKKICWSVEAQKAFDAVKSAITEAPVLKLPDFEQPLELFTVASSIGIGVVLNQEKRPVVYASRTLSNTDRNYTVTERECLAAVWALNKFRTDLGSLPVKVITDHAALTRLTNGKNLSSSMIRWVLKLAEFNIE